MPPLCHIDMHPVSIPTQLEDATRDSEKGVKSYVATDGQSMAGRTYTYEYVRAHACARMFAITYLR